MQQAITPDFFDWDEPWPWLTPGGRLGALERRIELALDRGEALDAAMAAIDLLDRIDGDPDLELLGDEADADGEESDQSFPEWFDPARPRDCRSNEDFAALCSPGLMMLEDSEMDDFREREEENYGRYGIDQTRPIGPENPALQ